MRDLNFFEDYIEETKFSINKQLIIYSIAMLVTIILIFYSLFNQIQIRRLSRDIAKLRVIIEDERLNKKIEEINEKKTEIDGFNESLEKIKSLDEAVEEDSIIHNYLLDNINSRIPEDVFFTSISINTDSIQIVGNSRDKWSISQLGKNLKSIEDFHEIFISNISSEEGYYNFILNINLKDVNIYEGEAIDQETEEQEVDEE